MVQYLAILAVLFAFGKTAYAVTESESSSALSKAKLDIAVMTIVESFKDDVESDLTSLACKCALTYSDYENEMAHQIQFQRCLDGKATAEPTDTEKLIQLLEVFKDVFGDKNRAGVTEGPLIFPRYCSVEGNKANYASNALNKWLKDYVPEGCVIHSFRHSLRDRLRAEQCPSDIIDQIGGWQTAGTGQSYGRGYELDILHNWLKKAVSDHAKLA